MADETLEKALQSIDIAQARAILSEAKSGGFMDGDIPETEEDIIKEAQYWYEESYKGKEVGMQVDAIFSILHIVDGGETRTYRSSGGYSEGDLREDVAENTVKVEEDVFPGTAENPEKVEADKPLESPPVVDGTINPVQRYNLPVPKDWEGDPEDFPRDISELTDKDVRRLSGEYNAYLSRAKWLLALAISDLASSTHLRDHQYRVALKAVVKVDPKTDKTKLKELIEAEAREDTAFAALDTAVLKHQNDVTILKGLVDIYSSNVDRLSREWTMRQDEYEKTR